MEEISQVSDRPPVHLVVGTPCYGGLVSCIYATALLSLQRACAREKIEISFRMVAGDSLITRARNVAVQQFLAIPGATHLLFIDADIGFSPEQVFDLLAADKDICGTIYPVKRLDWDRIRVHAKSDVANLQASAMNYVVELLDKQDVTTEGEFFRARYIGTGFMMIKRAVFGRMAERYPETRYLATHLGVNGDFGSGEANAFFDCMIDPDSGTYLSEDYTFCKRWLDMGGEIWAHVHSRLSHIGTHSYDGDLAAMLETVTALANKANGKEP